MFDYYNNDVLEHLAIPRTYFKNQTIEYKFWFRSLLQKIDSALIFKGLPEDIPEDFFKFILWARGWIAMFQTQRWGITVQPGTLSGYDFYYMPTKVAIANPYYNKILEIHKEAELIKLTPDFCGIFDIISHYAEQLAELTKSIMMQFINAKTPMVMVANSKAESELIKAIYDQVQNNESLVVYKNKLNDNEIIPRSTPFGFWNQDFKQTYIATDLLDNLQKVLDNFYMEIGLPTSLDKSSHVLNEEADFQSAQSQARIACWVSNLEESFKRVEKLFGIHMEVEYAQNNLTADGKSPAQDGQGSDDRMETKK